MSFVRVKIKIDLVKTRLPKFCPGGLNSGKCEIFRNVDGLVMAFSGILNKNLWFKYQRIRQRHLVSINNQESVGKGVIDTKIFIVVTRITKKGKGKRKNFFFQPA